MKHLNDNVLAAVEIKVTSFYESGTILNVACVPLIKGFRPGKHIFDCFMFGLNEEPVPEVELHRNIYFKEMLATPKVKEQSKLYGIDSSDAADLFKDWFGKLNLKSYKRLIPISYNWEPRARFLRDWLGNRDFDYIFQSDARSLVTAGGLINDMLGLNDPSKYPFQKIDPTYLGSSRGLKRGVDKSALSDCSHIIDLYKSMVLQLPIENNLNLESYNEQGNA